MVNLKAVQKLPVLEGHGFVHASLMALQTEVKVCVYFSCSLFFNKVLHSLHYCFFVVLS